jgi:hypothetical protein
VRVRLPAVAGSPGSKCSADLSWIVSPPSARLCLWLLVVYAPMLVWLCLPLTGLGGWSTAGIELFVGFALIGIFQLLVGVPMLLFSRSRGLALLRCGAVLFGGFLAAHLAGSSARNYAFERAGERAAPLISAITRHYAEVGMPRSFGSLVPEWLERLPTGLPPLELVSPGYEDNEWMLRASVPSGIFNFDQFVYLPDQNYPQRGWDGSVQRLGRWCYLHKALSQ